MKRSVSFKLICILCVTMIVSGCLSVTAFANDVFVTVYCEGEQYSPLDTPENFYGMVQDNYSDEADDDSVNVDYTVYSTLSEREKEYYENIVSLPLGTTSFTIEYNPSLTAEEFAAIDFRKIMYAVSLDHPEIFWYHGYSYKYKYSKTTGEVSLVIYDLKAPLLKEVEPPHATVTPETPVYEIEQYDEVNQAMWDEFHRISDELNLANRSRYSFARVLHDYLCTSVKYVINGGSCFDPYGTLVKKEAVCQGYAETFKMFCDYFEIPCVCIAGNEDDVGHMWNAIQMEDGTWYLLDVTWDDGGSKHIWYSYFLVGLETKCNGSATFSNGHVPNTITYLPPLSYAKYAYETRGTDYFNQTVNSYTDVEEQYLVLSPFTAQGNEVYYEGIRVDNVDFTTGSVFTTPDDKSWTVIILGDIDRDGSATVYDLSETVNRALSDDHAAQSVEEVAADVCKDGYIDVFDLYILQMMCSDLYNDFDVVTNQEKL